MSGAYELICGRRVTTQDYLHRPSGGALCIFGGYGATNKQSGLGGDFRASADNVDYLEQNIRKLLQTKFFYDLKKISEAPDHEVKFIWRAAE
jgi:hypothetical protein